MILFVLIFELQMSEKDNFKPDAPLAIEDIKLSANETPDNYCTFAKKYIHQNLNVVVIPTTSIPNMAYVNTWNAYAQERGLWVKLKNKVIKKELKPGTYKEVKVGLY